MSGGGSEPLRCDMAHQCEKRVTHIGEKGFIYCDYHADIRRPHERCRKLRAFEYRLLEAGTPLPSYKPLPRDETMRLVEARR